MLISEATPFIERLFRKHGLDKLGWTWRYSKHEKKAGHCSYSKKELVFVKTFVFLNDQFEVRELVLHEIAHALNWIRNSDTEWDYAKGHGPKWQAICREIGSTAERYASRDAYFIPRRNSVPRIIRRAE